VTATEVPSSCSAIRRRFGPIVGDLTAHVSVILEDVEFLGTNLARRRHRGAPTI
jgi:hypothetical protein